MENKHVSDGNSALAKVRMKKSLDQTLCLKLLVPLSEMVSHPTLGGWEQGQPGL